MNKETSAMRNRARTTKPAAPMERFRFTLEGLHFEAAPQPDGQLGVETTLGYLPFNADATEKRRRLLAILKDTQDLSIAHFEIDKTSRITVRGVFPLEPNDTAETMFYPVTRFLQEALPFIRLIGQQVLLEPKTA
jgi:hypothetical protein